ncbi:MAG TPA: sialidase family protein, partial [Bacteroidales bacterium]|nr:sialidase family protein [Bacteroidales bacterium]
VSEDNGDTWGHEIVVRDNLSNHDFGYPQITQNSDGDLVVIYYMTNDDRTSTFIEASIFQP